MSASLRTKQMQKFKIQTYQNLIKDVGGLTPENLFMFLGKVQETFGCVPREVVRDVAIRTGFSETRIYGALTSYRDFKVQLECDD
jgi:NADH:ubiquinone oxidoreductase subunit E